MTDNQRAYEAAICEVAHVNDIGDVSDGFHTFNQLYHQRAMLFAALVNQNRDISWKSRKHENGEPCFGGRWFVVTIDTPAGPYGYHYEEKYWDLFNCKELDCAKHWDGYTEKDVGRLMSLYKDEKCKTEPSCGDVARGHRLTDVEARMMQMREVDNALKLADVFPNPFSPEACVGPSDEVKYFCCGVDAYMLSSVYTTKGSLWFEDKPAGKLEAINDSVTEFNVIQLVFALETEFNYLSIHKLGEFNFKIEFNKEHDEIQLRLWRKE